MYTYLKNYGIIGIYLAILNWTFLDWNAL
jgi:hypothetical protein